MAKNKKKSKAGKIKVKVNKAARKRFKITATGKVMYWPAGRRHLQSAKSPKKRRQSRRWRELESPSDRKKIHKIMGTSHKRDTPQEQKPQAPVQPAPAQP
jgi:large subunit ribosomal protein L35